MLGAPEFRSILVSVPLGVVVEVFVDAQSSEVLPRCAYEGGHKVLTERELCKKGEIMTVGVVLWCSDEVMAFWRDVKGCLQCWLA